MRCCEVGLPFRRTPGGRRSTTRSCARSGDGRSATSWRPVVHEQFPSTASTSATRASTRSSTIPHRRGGTTSQPRRARDARRHHRACGGGCHDRAPDAVRRSQQLELGSPACAQFAHALAGGGALLAMGVQSWPRADGRDSYSVSKPPWIRGSRTDVTDISSYRQIIEAGAWDQRAGHQHDWPVGPRSAAPTISIRTRCGRRARTAHLSSRAAAVDEAALAPVAHAVRPLGPAHRRRPCEQGRGFEPSRQPKQIEVRSSFCRRKNECLQRLEARLRISR